MSARAIICGGRDFGAPHVVRTRLSVLHAAEQFSLVIVGGARGVDTFAEDWAREHHVPVLVEAADWSTHGRAAGPIRNARMLRVGKPDVVIAFPGGRGTADMVRQATAAGVRVIEVVP